MHTPGGSAAAPRNHTLITAEGTHRHHRPCFIDTMRTITPAETDAWRFYLGLHRDAWRPARAMLRAAHAGAPVTEALLEFSIATGITGRRAQELERVLRELSREAGGAQN